MNQNIDTYFNAFKREFTDDFEKLEVLSDSSSSIIDEC